MKRCRFDEEELVPIVAELAEGYTGYEHTSITYEKAQMLMGAVLYCIQEAESGETYTTSLQQKTDAGNAREVYEAGRIMVRDKAHQLQQLHQSLSPHFNSYGLRCLDDVIRRGIPEFLLHYDVRYAPQDTILTLDYPLLENLQNKTGVDAVLRYVQCVELEQRFLSHFSESQVRTMLESYHRGYMELVENICEIVLESIFRQNQEKVWKKESRKEMENRADEFLQTLIRTYYNNDKELLTYLRPAISGFVCRWNKW